ncbi:MAG: cytidine deaminase [Burkholderiaceae bacterium]|nr:MAG: cytidine deaminase [Burkholderiaceae bacterium]
MNYKKLLEAASEARRRAYAPYSHFQVGAAVLMKDERIFEGCNVENAAYSLCHCAERTAFCSAIAAGYRPGDFVALAVVADSPELVSPCGACRQVIHELAGGSLTVYLGNPKGEYRTTTAEALLPDAFNPQHLAK